MLKDWNWRTPSTDILNLDENKFVCRGRIIDEGKVSPRSEACTKWEKLKELKKYELTNSQCKKLRESHEATQRLTSQLQCVQEHMNSMSDIQGHFKEWNRILVEDSLTFPVNQK